MSFPTRNLHAQYTASSLTLTDGDAVSSWPVTQSTDGLAAAMAQANSSQQPIYHANRSTLGGPAVLFDGVNDILAEPYRGASVPNTTDGATLALVIDSVDVPDTKSGVIGIWGRTSFESATFDNSGSWGLNTSNSTHRHPSTGHTESGPITLIGRARASDGQYDLWVNGTHVLTGTDTSMTTSFPGGVLLGGANSGGSSPWSMYLAEAAVWTDFLTDDEITDLIAYHSTTYGIPAPSAFTATTAQTLPALTQTASGTVTIPTTASITQTLPSLTQAATGHSVAYWSDPVEVTVGAAVIPWLGLGASRPWLGADQPVWLGAAS